MVVDRHRKLFVDSVDMTDWHMVVETFPNGRHNFPRVTPERKTPAGPSRFTTTVRVVHASRGQFTYEDHGTPWSTVGRNLDVTLYRSDPTNDYRGGASFSDGTIRIQSYEPFGARWTRLQDADGSGVRPDRPDHEVPFHLAAGGSEAGASSSIGQVPYDFSTQKNIFFHRDRSRPRAGISRARFHCSR